MILPSDPHILYGMINMRLRDQYNSLEELCDIENIDMDDLILRLRAAGYEYVKEHNCFN